MGSPAFVPLAFVSLAFGGALGCTAYATYKPAPTEPDPPKTAVADAVPAPTAPPAVQPPVSSPAAPPVKQKPKAKKVAKTTPPKKPSPDQVVSSQ